MLRAIVGIGAALGAGVFAVLGVLFLYVLFARPMSWHGKVEGSVGVPLLAILIYFLLRVAKYAFSRRDELRWRKSEAYQLLLFGLIAYGGSIPWVSYLVIREDRKLWPALLICIPLYGFLVWACIKVFRPSDGEDQD